MFVLNQSKSIANQFLAELRDIQVQKDSMRFRKNLERLGEIMAYEVSKSLTYHNKEVTTPLQKTNVPILKNQPVLIGILRAALPFFQGFLNFYDQAESGFIGAYRQEKKLSGEELEIDFLYQAAPSIEGKEVILIDPMLATGKSYVTTIEHLLRNGRPKKIHIVSVIGAPEGIDYIKKNIKTPIQFWICALDEKLNHQAYILPGLGDAGDLAFGEKIQN